MRRPQFISENARNARGILGRLMAFIMARERGEKMRAMEALGIGQTDQILDVGYGHGRSLMEIAARAPRGRSVGIDPSELMVEIAAKRNRSLIDVDRADVVRSSVEALPFPDDVFDKAQRVHVLYFWKDIEISLREIARVLRPGGRLALLFQTTLTGKPSHRFHRRFIAFRRWPKYQQRSSEKI